MKNSVRINKLFILIGIVSAQLKVVIYINVKILINAYRIVKRYFRLLRLQILRSAFYVNLKL